MMRIRGAMLAFVFVASCRRERPTAKATPAAEQSAVASASASASSSGATQEITDSTPSAPFVEAAPMSGPMTLAAFCAPMIKDCSATYGSYAKSACTCDAVSTIATTGPYLHAAFVAAVTENGDEDLYPALEATPSTWFFGPPLEGDHVLYGMMAASSTVWTWKPTRIHLAPILTGGSLQVLFEALRIQRDSGGSTYAGPTGMRALVLCGLGPAHVLECLPPLIVEDTKVAPSLSVDGSGDLVVDAHGGKNARFLGAEDLPGGPIDFEFP